VAPRSSLFFSAVVINSNSLRITIPFSGAAEVVFGSGVFGGRPLFFFVVFFEIVDDEFTDLTTGKFFFVIALFVLKVVFIFFFGGRPRPLFFSLSPSVPPPLAAAAATLDVGVVVFFIFSNVFLFFEPFGRPISISIIIIRN
jgi:hypothetical protein